MNQSLEFLSEIFADLFDTYPSYSFMSKFIVNGTVNVSDILSHSFIKLNVVYARMWNFVYGTFPTKKDFIDFCSEHGYTTQDSVQFDKLLLDRIVNSFFHLKIGLLTVVSLDELLRLYNNLLEQTKDKMYIEDTIIHKLAYRFGFHEDVTAIKSNNLIVTAIQAAKNCRHTYVRTVGHYTNPISDNVNEMFEFSSQDLRYMNTCERTQYVMYKDNHFVMQLIDKCAIHVDCDDMPEDALSVLIDSCASTLDRHVLLMNGKCNAHDPLYTVTVHPDLYRLLPKVAKYFIQVSHNRIPKRPSLARHVNNSMYVLRFPFHQNMASPSFLKTFDKCVVNTTEHFDAETVVCQKYVVLDPCTVSSQHNDVYIWDRYRKLEQMDDLPNVRIHATKAANVDYTIVVDQDERCDVFDYIRKGMIPIIGVSHHPNSFLKHMVNVVSTSPTDDLVSIVTVLCTNPEMIDTLKRGGDVVRHLMRPDFVSLQWKHLLQHTCPIRTQDHKSNVILFMDFLVYYVMSRVEDIMTLSKNPRASNCVVIIDNRPNVLSLFAVLITLCNLNESWSCKVLTTKAGQKYYSENLGHVADVTSHDVLDVKRFHIDIYNKFMTSEELWDSLSNYDKCLIIQDDGMVFRKGIEDFLCYDYVGAPWIDGPGNEFIKQKVNADLVGNGGLSLRSVALMQQIVQTHKAEKKMLFFNNINNVPEDVYFCRYAKAFGANMPTSDKAALFSSEEIINHKSLGLHKVWVYHPPDTIHKLLKHILEDNHPNRKR